MFVWSRRVWVSLELAPRFQRAFFNGKLVQRDWRSEAPQPFPIAVPCKCVALPSSPAAGESLHSRVSPRHGKAASSVLHISAEPGCSFWQGCRGSIFTAGSFPSLLLAVSERLISL